MCGGRRMTWTDAEMAAIRDAAARQAEREAEAERAIAARMADAEAQDIRERLDLIAAEAAVEAVEARLNKWVWATPTTERLLT